MKKKRFVLFLSLCLGLSASCSPNRAAFEPNVAYIPAERDIACVPSAFPPLTPEEMQDAWAEELHVGRCFAKELDLYRAITSFKKALFLVPQNNILRIYEIEFCILQSYFLAGRYVEVTNFFGTTHLQRARPETFPAFRDLLIILWESYRQGGDSEKADKVYQLIEKNDEELANSLDIYLSLAHGKLCDANATASGTDKERAVDSLTQTFCASAKSPRTAEILNAGLPGLGYWYVGEKRSAITSFVINALFVWATYRFFEKGYTAAGIITLSLETGWYFGGINGAALEAKYYNERLYHQNAECMMTDAKLFPALMLDFSF